MKIKKKSSSKLFEKTNKNIHTFQTNNSFIFLSPLLHKVLIDQSVLKINKCSKTLVIIYFKLFEYLRIKALITLLLLISTIIYSAEPSTKDIVLAIETMHQMGEEVEDSGVSEQDEATVAEVEKIEKENISKENKSEKSTEEKLKNNKIENQFIYEGRNDKIATIATNRKKSIYKDYYSDYILKDKKYELFGKDFFKVSTFQNSNYVGKDYVLGVGDSFNIKIWNEYITTESKRDVIQAIVDYSGSIFISDIGVILVTNKSIKTLEDEIKKIMSIKSKDISIDISLMKQRNYKITIIGEVNNSGLVTINPGESIFSAIARAGSITNKASIRNTEVIRNGKKYVYDLYKYILGEGNITELTLLDGDIVRVPVSNNLIVVDGEVNNIAIYEIKNDESLAEIAILAGGFTKKYKRDSIQIEYFENNILKIKDTTDLETNIPETELSKVIFGRIDTEIENKIYLLGNVLNDGIYEFTEKETLKSLLQKAGGVKDNTYLEYATIVRKIDREKYKIIDIDLSKTNIDIQQDDKIYIYNINDIGMKRYASIIGHVNSPGLYEIYEGTKVKNLIFSAYGIKKDKKPYMKKAVIYRLGENSSLKIIEIDLEKAMNSDIYENIEINENDTLQVFSFQEVVAYDEVYLYGEVAKPGKYRYYEGLDIDKLIFFAQGLNSKAGDKIELIRRISGKPELKVLSLDKMKDFEILPGDQIFVRRKIGWEELQTVIMEGFIESPGEYSIRKGEDLNSLIQRAGGFRKDASPFGIEIKRNESTVKDLRELNLDVEYSLELEKSAKEQIKIVNVRYDKEKKRYLSSVILKDGDRIFVPEFKNQVKVVGEVYNPGILIYDKNIKFVMGYINLAGGLKENAGKSKIFVMSADGSTKNGKLRLIKLEPGDIIVVPVSRKKEPLIDVTLKVVKTIAELVMAGVLVNSIIN